MHMRDENSLMDALKTEIVASGLLLYKDWLNIEVHPSNLEKTAGVLDFNFNVRNKNKWSIECQLHIKCKFETINNNSYVDGQMRAENIKSHLGWSSTTRTIAQATDCINLYAQMRDLACSLEGVLENYYWKFGE